MRMEKQEKSQLQARLRGYREAGKSDRDARNTRLNYFEDFLTGKHWKGEDTAAKPAIPLTFYICDAQTAKVMDRPVKLSVSPQENSAFPLYQKDEQGQVMADAMGQPIPDDAHPFRQMVQSNAQAVSTLNDGQATDNEIYAMFMNALLQKEMEATDLNQKFYAAASLASWYSESWLVVSRDESRLARGEHPNIIDVIDPRRVIKDKEATSTEDMRFVAYEVDRTIGYVQKRWGEEETKDIRPGTTDANGTATNGDKNDSAGALVTLEVWIVRDESLQPYEPTEKNTEETEEEAEQVPRYERGWCLVHMCQGKLLGEPEDIGRMPMSWLPWYVTPGRLAAQGAPDLFLSQNFQIDQSMYYALENARSTGQNFAFVDKAAFVGKEDQLANFPGKIIDMQMDPALPQPVVVQQGLDVSPSHYTNIDKNRELLDTCSGVMDLKVGETVPRDASGEFMKEVKGGSAMRLAQIRDQQVNRAAKELARVLLDLALQDDEPVTLRVPGTQDQQVTFVPSQLRFDDEEFEARFDITSDSSATEPHDPIERDQFLSKTLAELSAMPRPLAEFRVARADWTFKEELKAALGQFWEEQTNQVDPVATAEQAKVAGQTAKDFSQGMQNLAKNLPPALAIELQLAAIPVVLAVARGEVPDLSRIQSIQQQLIGLPAAPAPGANVSGPVTQVQ
jgi:hypothetical protein